MTDHFPGCWTLESHPACRLARIRELEAEVRALRGRAWTIDLGTEKGVTATPRIIEVEPYPYAPAPVYMDHFGLPEVTHDHIDPPIHSQGPTWGAHQDEPPSFTP